MKFINVLLIFFLLFTNVIGILPQFSKVSANQITVTDDLIFGSLINASQGGRRGGGQSFEKMRGFGSAIGGARKQGHRLGTTVGRGQTKDGKEVATFNPSLVDIDILYNQYINYMGSNGADYITYNLNREYGFDFVGDKNIQRGLAIAHPFNAREFASFNDVIINNNDFYYAFAQIVYTTTGSNALRYYEHSSNTTTYLTNELISDLVRITLPRSNRPNTAYTILTSFTNTVDSTFYIKNMYLTNNAGFTLTDANYAHGPLDIPSKEVFINNYVTNFGLEYDSSTGQILESDKRIAFNLDDFIDENIEISPSYVTNNYIVYEGDTIIEGDSKDYTSILQRIFIGIIELPDKMYARFEGLFTKDEEEEPEEPVEDEPEEPVEDEPEEPEEKEGEYTKVLDDILDFMKELPKKIGKEIPEAIINTTNEAGTNLWDVINNLIDKIGNLIDGLLDLGTTIFNAFYDGLSEMLQGIVDLLIPNDSEMQKTKNSVSDFNDVFQGKFEFITEPMKSFGNIFSGGSSAGRSSYSGRGGSDLYAYTFEMAGHEVHVLPSILKPYIDVFRNVANGIIVIWTFLHIYYALKREVKI